MSIFMSMLRYDDKTILNIIKDITDNGKKKEIIDMFLHGNCYDFALMIWLNTKNTKIYFIEKYFRDGGHYIIESYGNFYDITGKLDIDLSNYTYEIDDTKKDLLKTLKSR